MTTTQTPTVFIVDDDPAVRDSLEMLVAAQGLQVSGFPNAQSFLQHYRNGEIGCLVLDIRMPQITGLALQEMLCVRNMQLPILFITGHGDVEECSRAFRNGAIDFLTKPVDPLRLLDGLKRGIRMCIQQHEQRAETEEVLNQLARISPREREVLDLIADGLSSKEIAQQLHLSPRTVDVHRANLFDKLNVHSLADLIRFYLRALEATGKKRPE
ncbi:response regulator transcription factor [Crenobacter luteus]|uniref:LuxR family transcriptional regulator n=1 Tax=Crenobacter luteus TaxID=1452487 RepID=A0A165FYQ8_9NEIS|nr:response regulator [Crenobacter luteus]KZE34595.1 LuxR family transcriptional regulator [Crenobacter luteus]